jgi:hypothetical protein
LIHWWVTQVSAALLGDAETPLFSPAMTSSMRLASGRLDARRRDVGAPLEGGVRR